MDPVPVSLRRPLARLVLGLSLPAIACAHSGGERAAADSASAATAATAEARGAAPAARPDTSVVVNGAALSDVTLRQLQQLYPVAIAPGRYWYDAVSGGWGREGEPVAGQMMPGLALGGPLAANASRGRSGVFINGRQITSGEKSYLERLCQTPVMVGRYWIMATGIGGYEGQPASFNLAACPGAVQQGGGGGGRSSTRTFCDPNGACTSTGILGSITTTPD